jgi:hypothetical protein
LDLTLKEYVRQQIDFEKSGIVIVQEALQNLEGVTNSLNTQGRSFSPTNLSFGQGSPMSRGSMIDSLNSQELNSSIHFV